MTGRFLGLFFWACVAASWFLLLSPAAFHAAPGDSGYHVIRQISPGGDGGYDYITVDPDARRIYLPRGTHIQVLDEGTGKLIADISDLKGLHGVEFAPKFNRGFVTGNDPDAEIYLLDLKALKVTSKLTPTDAKGSDSLEYDPASKRAFIKTAQTNTAQAVDAATGKIVGTVTFPGRPEGAVPDGKGSMFQDIYDKSLIVEYDTKTLAIKNTWPSAPCEKGVPIAMDKGHRVLFIGCRGATRATDLMVVMNADNGKVVTTMPIGVWTDGIAFDPSSRDVFVTCRDDGENGKNGVINIFHEDAPDKYSKVADIKTVYGTRTIALDPKTHHIFTMGTEQTDPPPPPSASNPNPGPKQVFSSFVVVEIGK
jgi:DNA-binding beta-propeller fold protein YncE